MELSVMERYVAFICSELPKTRRVLLTPPPPMENGEYGYKRMSKIGPRVYMETTIEIVETYTRSAKLCVKFEDYQMNDIFYMSRFQGPDKLLEEIDKKIDKIVNRTLVDDGRQEWVREQYKIKSEDFPLFKFRPGVEVDVYGDAYKNYSKKHFKEWEPGMEYESKESFINKIKTNDEFAKKWGFNIRGVEVDVYGDLYERYTKTNVVKNDDGSETHISPPGHYNQMTKDEFIDKLRTDDEFNKKWGNSSNKIVE